MERLHRLARSLRTARAAELPTDVNAAISTLLPLVMRNEHRAVSELLSSSDFNVNNSLGRSQRTLLHIAANVGAQECLTILLKRGADVNCVDKSGVTPLQLAARNGHTKCIHKLLESKADIEISNRDGMTALHWLASNGRTELLLEFLPFIKNIDIEDANKQTPLHLACLTGHRMTVHKLVDFGADIEKVDARGYTPLLYSCSHGHADLVSDLLLKGAKISNSFDKVSPLRIALENGHKEVCFVLIENKQETLFSLLAIAQDQAMDENKALEVLKYLCGMHGDLHRDILIRLAELTTAAGLELLCTTSNYESTQKMFSRTLRLLYGIYVFAAEDLIPRQRSETMPGGTRSRMDSTSSRLLRTLTSQGVQRNREFHPPSIQIDESLSSLWNTLEHWFLLIKDEIERIPNSGVDEGVAEKSSVEENKDENEKPGTEHQSLETWQIAREVVRSKPKNTSTKRMSNSSLESLRLSQPALEYNMARWNGELSNSGNLSRDLGRMLLTRSISASYRDAESVNNQLDHDSLGLDDSLMYESTEDSMDLRGREDFSPDRSFQESQEQENGDYKEDETDTTDPHANEASGACSTQEKNDSEARSFRRSKSEVCSSRSSSLSVEDGIHSARPHSIDLDLNDRVEAESGMLRPYQSLNQRTISYRNAINFDPVSQEQVDSPAVVDSETVFGTTGDIPAAYHTTMDDSTPVPESSNQIIRRSSPEVQCLRSLPSNEVQATTNPLVSGDDGNSGVMASNSVRATKEMTPNLANISKGRKSLNMMERIADRLCAVIHGYHLISYNRPSWESPRKFRVRIAKFNQFISRNEEILQLFVARKPEIIFDHFHFLLDSPLLLQRYLPIIHQQSFKERKEWFYENLHNGQDIRAQALDEKSMITISRGTLLLSSCDQLLHRESDILKKNLTVQFEGEAGLGDGVVREWLDLLFKEILNPDFALFTLSADGSTFQPNSNSAVNPDHLNYFQFAGRMMGMALYHKRLVNASFTRSFYKHILGIPVGYQDVASIDPDYAKNLQWILDHDISNLMLDLTFAIETDVFGTTKEVCLKPGGNEILVTEDNKDEYVQLAADLKMTQAIKPQIYNFLEGFHEFIPHSLVALFNDYELEMLLSGIPEIDYDDWKTNASYQSGYDGNSQPVVWFWEVVRELDEEERTQLLQFATGSSRVPWGGFSSLTGSSGLQNFTISAVPYTKDVLPTASTCFNLLKLPEYGSKEELREKLKTAIKHGSRGFEFT